MITACILTKNEEKYIAQVIDHIVDYVDEVLIIDSLSTDHTKKIALGKKVMVIQHDSHNDFGSQRNYAIKHATHEWIFMLDADERCSDAMRNKLRTIARDEQKYDGYTFLWKNYCDGNLVEEVRKLCLFQKHGFYEDTLHEKVQGLSRVANVGNEDVYLTHMKQRSEQQKHFVRYEKIIEDNLLTAQKQNNFARIAYFQYAKKRQQEKELIWLNDYISV